VPDESPLPPDSLRATPSQPGWRANVRSLALAIVPNARRRRTEAKGFVNPLRRPDEQTSLFGEILDWMLAPLLLLWPMSVTLTFLVAQSIANAPYDRNLTESLDVMASYLRHDRGRVSLAMPMPLREVLHSDGTNQVLFMVLGLRGELVAGDREMPLPPDDEPTAPESAHLRFAQVRGTDMRIAYKWVGMRDAPAGSQPVLVQVAESLEQRELLANEIIRGVIVPQFTVLPVAVLLVWFGLTRGLAPLSSLQAKIRARRPDDLAPIDPRAAPEEMGPLVDAFNQLLERMQQNLTTQRRFMADAAHQMKTPLAGLRTQAELALRETDPVQLRRSLRQIAGSTERATHLINQLLALARAEHQATDLASFEVVELKRVVLDVVHDSVAQALARRIDLGFEAPDQPVRIVGVPVLLRELLKNLIDNALRYAPEGGSATVRLRATGESVFLDVEDTGPGIPEADRQLVFDRFYRVLGTNVDGSGLGLAIVREIAEQHGALLRIGANPTAGDPAWPGTLVSVEFERVYPEQPDVKIS
jgi:two-component system sensor histidine kinase TctE